MTALADVSFGRKPSRDGQKGSHGHHHNGQHHNGQHEASGGSVKNASDVLDEPDVSDALDVPDIPDLPDEEDISDVNELVNTTGHWFAELLANVSEYLPVNVDYATNVGNSCSPDRYNSDYYNVPSLVISGVLFILGILFCFFGQ